MYRRTEKGTKCLTSKQQIFIFLLYSIKALHMASLFSGQRKTFLLWKRPLLWVLTDHLSGCRDDSSTAMKERKTSFCSEAKSRLNCSPQIWKRSTAALAHVACVGNWAAVALRLPDCRYWQEKQRVNECTTGLQLSIITWIPLCTGFLIKKKVDFVERPFWLYVLIEM